MAEPRTPQQLNIVLGSIRKITDPQARLQALQNLRDEIADAQSAALGAAVGDPLAGIGNVKPGAEYEPVLKNIDQAEQEANSAVQKGATPNRLTTAPTPGSQADVANNLAQQRVDSANQNAQQRIDLAKEQAASLDKIRQAQLQGKDVTAALNQAKFDFAQKVADAKAQQAAAAAQAKVDAANALAQQRIEDNANTNLTNAVKNQDDTQNTAQGQAVTQADSRNATAATLMDAAQKNANDAAQHGSIVAGSVLNNTLAGAPGFAASMGGAPVNVQAPAPMLTQDQKVQIGQALLAGATKQQVLPQVADAHNGNLAVLASGGPQFTAGPPAMIVGGKPIAAEGTGIPSGYGTGPGQIMPQIVASGDGGLDVGTNPTLAAAGSGGL